MLRFASKYAYVPEKPEEDAEEVVLDEEDMSSNLNEMEVEMESAPASTSSTSSTSSRLRAFAPPASPLGAAAPMAAECPPPPPTSELNFLSSRARAKAPTRIIKKKVRNIGTNVFSVKLGFLSQDVEVATGDATFCSHCPAALSSTDVVSSASDESSLWTCQFCGSANSAILSPEEIPKADTVDYILEAPISASSTEDSQVVFCVDTSGSMCVTSEIEGKVVLKGGSAADLRSFVEAGADQHFPGQRRNVTYVSRLQAVQAAIDTQLNTLATLSPNTRVNLLTFNSEVKVIGDGTQAEETVTGDKLHKFDELLKVGENFADGQPITTSKSVLSKKLFELEECGPTALGPALLVAAGIAGKKIGSKVILCTDGMSNVGLGALECLETTEQKAAADAFYQNIGLYAQQRGVIISVISIRGSEANLERLGVLADLTGGEVEIVDPCQITSQFSSILANPLVATKVSIKVVLGEYMEARDTDSEVGSSIFVKDVGNVTSDSEVLLEYGMKRDVVVPADLKTLPVQVQVHYVNAKGVKNMRVISSTQSVTHEQQQAEKEVDVSVMGVHALQQCASIAQKGDYTGARLLNMKAKRTMARVSPASQSNVFAGYSVQNAAFEQELQGMQAMEQREGRYFDSAPVSNLQSARASSRSDSASTALWKCKKSNAKKFS